MKLIAALALALVLSGCMTQRGFPPEHQIVNFDRVDDTLYRGAQPTLSSLDYLKSLGIKSVVNLRMPQDILPGEPAAVSALGMRFVNLPMNGVTAPPPAEMDRMLDVIEALPAPVFIHCQFGCDRTGTVIACWRICHGWQNEAALQEAKNYGISPLLQGMQELIRTYARTDHKPHKTL
jgi:protein tyrosine/serine phosphatase